MQAQGLVLKEEPHTLRVPRSQRGGEVVEPLVREQWFVRMEPLAKPALEVGPEAWGRALWAACLPAGWRALMKQ